MVKRKASLVKPFCFCLHPFSQVHDVFHNVYNDSCHKYVFVHENSYSMDPRYIVNVVYTWFHFSFISFYFVFFYFISYLLYCIFILYHFCFGIYYCFIICWMFEKLFCWLSYWSYCFQSVFQLDSYQFRIRVDGHFFRNVCFWNIHI